MDTIYVPLLYNILTNKRLIESHYNFGSLGLHALFVTLHVKNAIGMQR